MRLANELTLNRAYVISALQADPTLPFDMGKLRALVQADLASWERHREWLVETWRKELELLEAFRVAKESRKSGS